MFSEYASRFLAQSQSRMSAIRDGRTNNNQAPLFFSAADHLHEDRDEEVQDFYTLQSSRRHFGAYAASSVAEEDDGDEEGLEESNDSIPDPRRNRGKLKQTLPGDIKSSWKAKASNSSISSSSTASAHSQLYKGKDKMVDIKLDDSVRVGLTADENSHPDMINSRSDSEHVAIDVLPGRPSNPSYKPSPSRQAQGSVIYSPNHTRKSQFMPQLSSPSRETHTSVARSVPGPVAHPPSDPPAHDSFWSSLYILNMAGMFAAGFVTWLHTEDGSQKYSIYKVIQHSLHILTVDTLVAVGVSLVWFYLLRRYVKFLIYILILGVPVALIVLSVYSFVQSYRGEGSIQDKVMRWTSLGPAIMATMWVWVAYKGRNALGRAVGIIQLSCKILGENPALVLLSFTTLLGTIAFTWLWINMFQRIFLYGHGIKREMWNIWVMDSGTWFLAAYFVFMYLWTLGVAAGFQRATAAATVSQWYFYRHAIPTTPSSAVMSAALHHSITILFGTICFSSFTALMIQLPILVLPRRVTGFMHLFCFNFIASPIAALIHPLTLTYAAIHSQPLVYSSRTISSMRFIDTAGFGGSTHHPRAAYRLSKMLLTATRTIVAMAMGLGAWVRAARDPQDASLYAYIVGMIAGFIGWGILGATEGCLGNVVDACLVCVGSEGPEGSHCREAQMVFGG